MISSMFNGGTCFFLKLLKLVDLCHAVWKSVARDASLRKHEQIAHDRISLTNQWKMFVELPMTNCLISSQFYSQPWTNEYRLRFTKIFTWDYFIDHLRKWPGPYGPCVNICRWWKDIGAFLLELWNFRSVRVHFITSRYNGSHCRSLSGFTILF